MRNDSVNKNQEAKFVHNVRASIAQLLICRVIGKVGTGSWRRRHASPSVPLAAASGFTQRSGGSSNSTEILAGLREDKDARIVTKEQLKLIPE